ncbi:MAG: hypothetical protein ACRYFU_25005, partial [Janthinobacterium lividum]
HHLLRLVLLSPSHTLSLSSVSLFHWYKSSRALHIKDSYDRKARLYPALLVVLPLALTIGAAASLKLPAIESAGAALASCGGAFLLTQLARDAGKRKEDGLFKQWGGMPSVAILRHRDQRLDTITKGRYHKKLSTLVKGTKVPSATDEQHAPELIDSTYSAWCAYLRAHTRDTKKHALLFQENVNYGYRRNVLGLRRVGLVTSALSLSVSSGLGYVAYRFEGQLKAEFVAAGIVALLLLLFWSFIVSPLWVRTAADAYAERLIETIEHLGLRDVKPSE